ncbi:contractile injection system tape measure protein [Motiliproteus sp.]|uniref:contractile injection system tape measure protein n=1 Tax=Motiliproteus sp. TaxID=1898955 RepID=UPI003BA8DF86
MDSNPDFRSTAEPPARPPPHRIRRLRLQAQLSSNADASLALALRTALQQSTALISESLDNALSEALQRRSDSPPNSTTPWFYLPKLELPLSLSPAQLNDPQQLLQALQQQLPQLLAQQLNASLEPGMPGATADQPSNTASHSDLRQTASGQEGFADESDPGSERPTAPLNEHQLGWESLLYYLHQGSLPWYLSENERPEQRWLPLLDNPQSLNTLMPRLERFEAWVRLLQLLLGTNRSATWQQALGDPDQKRSQTALLQSLRQLASKGELISPQQGALVLAAVAPPQALPTPGLSLPGLTNLQFEQILQQLRLSPSQQRQLEQRLRHYDLLPQTSASEPATNPARSSSVTAATKQQRLETPSCRVSFAGLILLAPYLPRLFERMSWLDTNQQLKRHNTALAAKALIYLATGQQHLPEHQLGWIKVLLALDPDSLLLIDEQSLPPELITELDLLLDSLLSHWSGLKSTSANGLRQAFLQRQGLIRQQEQQWQLWIERQGMDVLLDQLPFSIETVKLLWLPQPIHVRW